jgi:hypothetical protein
VAHEYVSTTLGLHKSVCTPPSTLITALNLCLQLEHTGTTITQTLSGLWLDSKKEDGKTGSPAILSQNEPRLQWLLNGFLFVNLLHLAAIWGLRYLNEWKQNIKKGEIVQNEGEDEDEERLGASGPSSGIEGPSSSPESPSWNPSDQIPDGSRATSPLLPPRDVYRSSATDSPPHSSPQDTTMTGVTITPAEVRRGKLFALLCAATVVSTWLLFFVTSFIKIRSRREREGKP